MPARFIALFVLFLLAACGESPATMSDERVLALQSDLRNGGTWKCDRWAGGWGGSYIAGVKFGVWLAERRVPVEVPSGELCASAAALAALGAPQMIKSARGVLAFHGPTPALPPMQKVLLRSLLTIWKVPDRIIDRILALKPGEFWIPKGDDLELLVASRAG
jgi:hypothetical protein